MPVDTYVQPARSGLHELASALGPLNAELGALFEQRGRERKEADLRQAEADDLLSNGEGYAEGVRQGRIPAHYSATYVKRRKELDGDRIGRRLSAGYLAAYEGWEGKNGDDPAASDAFLADYIASNLGTEDPDVLAGAAPHIQALQGNAFEADTRYRSGRLRAETLRSNLAAVNSTLDDAAHDGLSTGKGTDYAGSGDRIEALRSAFEATGGDPAAWDLNIMELVAAQAVERKDAKWLDFFDRTVPGTSYTYGDTKEGGEFRRQAVDRLEALSRQEVADGDRAAEKARQAQEHDAKLAAAQAIAAGQPVPEEVLAAGEKADPLFRTRIGEWRDNWAKGEREPARVREIEARILAGGGMKVALEAVGDLGSSDDVAQVLATGRTFESARPSVDDILGSTAARTIFDTLASRTKANGGPFDPITGLSDEGLAAQWDFRHQLTEWAAANPGASSRERDEAIGQIGAGILGRLKQAPNGIGPSVYDRDPALTFGNPHDNPTGAGGTTSATGAGGLPPSMGGAAAAEPAKPAEDRGPVSMGLSVAPPEEAPAEGGRSPFSLAPIARPSGIDTPEQWDYWNRFSEEEKAKVRARESATGKPLGVVLDELKAKSIKPTGKPSPAAAPTPEPQASITPISYRPGDDGTAPARAPADLAFLSSRAIQGAERPDSFTGMRPEFASGLEAMLRGAPPEIAGGLQVMSGYRSPQRQAELWAAALRKYGSAAAARKWVAPPGRSGHNHGHAADLAFNGVRLDKAPRHVREWVHANAAAYGLSFPLGNEAWHVELSGARNGKGQHQIAEGRRSFTREDAEAFLQAAMMTDPLDLPGTDRDGEGAFVPGDVGAGRLLDLIGQHESAGNYNAVFGNADSTRDLGQLTVTEIIRQQRLSKRRGAYSTAIGKYQFLRKTLESLKDELGLSGEERFTPELQDRLAVALLERRGYRAFKEGRLSARAFALRLSQEWASVEKPGTGRSFYAGDGFHGRAPVKTREVYAALGLPALSI